MVTLFTLRVAARLLLLCVTWASDAVPLSLSFFSFWKMGRVQSLSQAGPKCLYTCNLTRPVPKGTQPGLSRTDPGLASRLRPLQGPCLCDLGGVQWPCCLETCLAICRSRLRLLNTAHVTRIDSPMTGDWLDPQWTHHSDCSSWRGCCGRVLCDLNSCSWYIAK